MRLSPEARDAAKTAQLARLAVKGTPGYPAMYASQPTQIRIAAEQREARKEARAKQDAVSGVALEAAADAVAIFKAPAPKKGEK